jgi:hypothetical protein
MRPISTILLLLVLQVSGFGQCSDVSISISSSDTSYVQLYHAGLFLIDSGYANICEWEVTTFDGSVVHQDTTSGLFEEQSFSLFNHLVPISDSVVVNLVITNPIIGITCSITDTLIWEEIEVLPGSFIGNWAVLGEYGGVEDELITSARSSQPLNQIQIQPTLVTDGFTISNIEGNAFVVMYDSMGREVFVKTVYAQEKLVISSFKSGMYYVHIYNTSRNVVGVNKILKL